MNTLLRLSSWCLVIVVWLFLTVPLNCLLFVNVVLSDHDHLLFYHVKAQIIPDCGRLQQRIDA